MDVKQIFDDSFWKNGPKPGQVYNFPCKTEAPMEPATHSQRPMVTGTSVIGLRFNKGIIIAADTVCSYGSLARYRAVSRLYKVNDSTVVGGGGDYADFQFIKSLIEQKVIDDECLSDGFSYTPKSLFSWLSRVLYNRRSKFNPLWNSLAVGGIHANQPFLGYIDKIGTAYESSSVASGYGAYIAQPLLRSALEVKPDMDEEDAKLVIDYCMKVLYYRDARSWNRYEMAVVSTDKSAILEGPVASKTTWNIAGLVGGFE